MTNQEIRKQINRLNSGKSADLIFTRPISSYVDFAKVWEERPKESNGIIKNWGSYSFFFIKNENGKYVGAVLDMYSDLHWYVLPEFRKKGYLTTSLKLAILPYLFSDRDKQRITIKEAEIGEKNYLNSKGVALKLGFKSVNMDETVFELKESDFVRDNIDVFERNGIISKDRIEILKSRVNYAYSILFKVSDELLMKFGDDDDLKEVAKEVRKYVMKIDDLAWENNVTDH